MSNISKDVLIGFIEEVKNYLPEIAESVAAYKADNNRLDALETAHRHSHTIKGASSMMGMTGLSHIAYYLEEVMESVGAGQIELNDDVEAFVIGSLALVEGYLDGSVNETLDEAAIVTEATMGYRRLKGLPEGGDEAAISALVAQMGGDGAAAASQSDSKPKRKRRRKRKPAESKPEPVVEVEPIEVISSNPYDDFSAELMEAFNEEAEDHMRNIQRYLGAIKKSPEDTESLTSLRRTVHTLKGAAATVGVPSVAELSHRMEDLLDRLEGGVTAEQVDLLFDSADLIEDQLAEKDVSTQLPAIYMRYDAILGGTSADETVEIKPLETFDIGEAPTPAPQEAQAAPTQPRVTGEIVRVPLERLDEIVRLTSEFVISRTTFEQRMHDLTVLTNEFKPSLERLQRLATKFDVDLNVRQMAARTSSFYPRAITNGKGTNRNGGSNGGNGSNSFNAEFDPLEFDQYTEMHIMARELLETTSDIRTIHNELRHLLGDFDTILNRQGRISSEVQDKLMRTRMVPLATITTRLHRAVRVVARQLDKQVDLEVIGENIELDKKVLEQIVDPIIHALRNAADHGIEPSELRRVLGKPETGSIRLHAFHEGNQVVIQISDDGAGIDPEKIRAKAISAGYITESEAATLSKDELFSLLFTTGFSTATEVSEISGRGVGLDVLKSSVTKLKGTVTLHSTENMGSMFTIRLPMTLAVIRALMVRANQETFAVPLAAVSQILRLERSAIDQVGQKPVLRVNNALVPISRLGEILQLKQPQDEYSPRLPVLIINVNGRQVAVVVDEIIEGRDIVIKSLGSNMREVRAITGATLMGDGSVVLILNPADLIGAEEAVEMREWTPKTPAAVAKRKVLDILVVDDSLSVRRVVSNLVKSAGWNPIPARDGMEALEIIQASNMNPDLILLDVEMPRMNGYELTTTLRANSQYADIPIVMLTSRSSEKHRRKAFEVGVSDYLIKPYQDDVLLSTVRRLIRVEA